MGFFFTDVFSWCYFICLLDEILGVFRFLHRTESQSQSHIFLDNLLLYVFHAQTHAKGLFTTRPLL